MLVATPCFHPPSPDPFFARLEVERRRAEAQQREPLAIQFGHIAQRLAGKRGIIQIMFFDERAIKFGPLVIFKQPYLDAPHDIGFVSLSCADFAPKYPPQQQNQPNFSSRGN